MFVATVIICVLLAALTTSSALMKLSHRAPVVQSYARVGVPENRLDLLAFTLLAGAAGLVIGLFWPPLGIAAAGGLVCYFLAAIAAHIRARDTRRLAMPMMLALMAVAALTLRLVTP